MEKISNVRAIKQFFEKDDGRTVTMAEMKELTVQDRIELGKLAAIELGYELESQTGAGTTT
jgi:hypothetical protein